MYVVLCMHLVLDGVVGPYIHMYTWVPRHRGGVVQPYIRMYMSLVYIVFNIQYMSVRPAKWNSFWATQDWRQLS